MPDNMILRRHPAGSAPDSRLTVPWDDLSDEVKILVKRASSGSLEGLQVLVAWMELNKLTARQDRLVPILFNHVSTDPPLKFDLQKAKFAAASLEGIVQSFLWQLSLNAISTSLTMKYFLRLWESIWKWVDVLYWRIYEKNKAKDKLVLLLEGTDEYRTVMAIRRLLVVITEERYQLFSRLYATEGFVPLLVDAWARLSETKSGLTYAEETWANLTRCFLSVMVEGDGVGADQVVREFGGMEKLAGGMLRNLGAVVVTDEAKQGKDGGRWRIRVTLPIISFVSSTSFAIPGLSTALLAQHSMIEVMRTLTFYVDAPLPSLQNDVDGQAAAYTYLVRNCIWSSLVYVKATSRITDGYTWLTQAVRSQVIQSMLKIAAAFPISQSHLLPSLANAPNQPKHAPSTCSTVDIEIEMIYLLKILSTFLIYRSFTRELERSMADPQVALLEAQVPRVGIAGFWDAWVRFKGVVRQRMSVKRAFDKTGKYNQTCSAADCENKETKRYFKLCGACQNSPYCSKACQASDWKSGRHRAHCERIRRHRAAGQTTPISDHDHQFIQFSTDYYIRAFRVQLAQARDHVFTATGSKDYVVYVEHTGPPLAFVVDVPDAFPEYFQIALKGQPRPKRKDPLPLVYLVVNVPFGKSNQMYIFGADMADAEDMWVRQVLDHASIEAAQGQGEEEEMVEMVDGLDEILIGRAQWFYTQTPYLPIGEDGPPPSLSIFSCPYESPSYLFERND